MICIKHFESKYAIKGKRNKLDWKLNPVPTIHSVEALKKPSVLCSSLAPRREPKRRIFQKDQLEQFKNNDSINDFTDSSEKTCPSGFECKINDDCIVYYKLEFDLVTSFPAISQSIKVDKDLHVQGRPLFYIPKSS